MTDAALGNCLRSNGALSLSTHCPNGKVFDACADNASADDAKVASRTAWRICRLSRLRVTERRACRFGTTSPSQHCCGESSTGGVQSGAVPVDNSLALAFFKAPARGKGERVIHMGSGFRRKGVDTLLEIWRREPPAGAAVTGAAPHYLRADGPLLSHRRTRAGDAAEAGRTPSTPGVLLGMPRVGVPA